MIDKDVYYGGATYESKASDFTLYAPHRRFWLGRLAIIKATTTGLDCFLPDARLCRMGFPIFCIINVSAFQSIQIKDADGGNIYNLPDDEVLVIGLADNTTSAGEWYVNRFNLTGTG